MCTFFTPGGSWVRRVTPSVRGGTTMFQGIGVRGTLAFEFPDGNLITVGAMLFRGEEVLLQPSFFYQCDGDIRKALFADGNMFTVGAKCPVALQRGRLSEMSYKTCAFTSLLYDTAQLTRKVQTRRRPTFSQTEHHHRSRQTFPLRGSVIPALLRCWKETTAYNNDVYLLLKELLNLVASLVPSRYRCWRSLYCSGALLVSGSTWSAQKAWTTRKSTTIDLASSVGLNGMKVDTSSLKWIASSSPVFNAQLCCKEEWDDAVQRTAWCKSSSYMSCCDFGVPCDCSHHSVTAPALG